MVLIARDRPCYVEQGILYRVGLGVRVEGRELVRDRAECCAFLVVRGAVVLHHEIAEILDREADQPVEMRVRFRRHARRMARDEAPHHRGVLRIGRGGQVQEERERDRHLDHRRLAAMDVPDGIAETLLPFLARIGRQELVVLVDGARNDVEIELLGLARSLEHVECQALGRRIGQPLVDRQAVALRLRDLLAVLVEEQLVDEVLRRAAAEDLADPVIDRRVGLVILAEHFEIDAECCPAHAEIRLPLQLHRAAGHRQRRFLAVLVVECDGSGLRVDRLHRDVEHAPGLRRDRQERAVGRLALRSQRRQHHLHDVVVARGRAQKHVVEPAGRVVLGRAREFVVEAERVEEAPQHRIVVVAEALVVAAERVRDRRQRLVQMRLQKGAVRHIVGDLAHPVHVVGEAQKPGAHPVLGQDAERMPHHRRARHFAERADMRQAGRPVTGLEQHLVGKSRALVPFDDLARLLERPRLGVGGRCQDFGRKIDVGGKRVGHVGFPFCAPRRGQPSMRAAYLRQ